MTGPASRRGFLRGLTTLPLIGGGVALVGAPFAVAEPVTAGMLATYSCWLHYERIALMYASVGAAAGTFVPELNPASHWHFPHPFDWEVIGRLAQWRAPLVLATVGCEPTSLEAEEQWGGVFRCA